MSDETIDYARFDVYQTELDFDLECRDCRDWRTRTLDVGHCRTLQDMIGIADAHVREVHLVAESVRGTDNTKGASE